MGDQKITYLSALADLDDRSDPSRKFFDAFQQAGKGNDAKCVERSAILPAFEPYFSRKDGIHDQGLPAVFYARVVGALTPEQMSLLRYAAKVYPDEASYASARRGSYDLFYASNPEMD